MAGIMGVAIISGIIEALSAPRGAQEEEDAGLMTQIMPEVTGNKID